LSDVRDTNLFVTYGVGHKLDTTDVGKIKAVDPVSPVTVQRTLSIGAVTASDFDKWSLNQDISFNPSIVDLPLTIPNTRPLNEQEARLLFQAFIEASKDTSTDKKPDNSPSFSQTCPIRKRPLLCERNRMLLRYVPALASSSNFCMEVSWRNIPMVSLDLSAVFLTLSKILTIPIFLV
jgi:hypothetical protein